MREIIETLGIVLAFIALITIAIISIFGKPNEGNYSVFKRCVEVGVEVEKCNTIAGFKKEKQND